MFNTHFGPFRDPEERVTWLLLHGRAAILFLVVAGVGVSLLTRGTPQRSLAGLRIGSRAVVLLPLGLALQMLDHHILVILQYYAIYFVIAALALRLGDRVLLTSAAAVALGGPALELFTRRAEPAWFAAEASLRDPVTEIAADLAVSGAYPVVSWTSALLLGMWLGRLDLGRPAVRWRIVAGGVVTAIAAALASRALLGGAGDAIEPSSWRWLLVDDPHSHMPLWLIGAMGSAAAAMGAALWVVDRFRRLTWPVVALGQLVLTVYVAHLFLLAARPEVVSRETVGEAALSALALAALAALAAVLWRWRWRYGPLEALVRAPGALLARLAR